MKMLTSDEAVDLEELEKLRGQTKDHRSKE